MSERTITLKIKRQASPDSKSYWEDFKIATTNEGNVISILQKIAEKPINAKGEATSPVSWDCGCLENVCGSCSMVVNGVPKQSCTVLIKDLKDTVTLEPMFKFPILRDLRVDRSSMFQSLKKVKAWVPLDGLYPLGAGPQMSDQKAQERYSLSTCMTCGVCLQVCPQFGPNKAFMGAAAISQARLFNEHPVGENLKSDRLDALSDEGGIMGCGKAQNCVKHCPKEIPLTESLAEIYKDTTLHLLKKFFKV
jgi:succinate dehydrogenase / fumarate reductase iron-sulfur subunit